MEGETGILEERVQVRAVRRHARQSRKRVRGEHSERQKTHANYSLHTKNTGAQTIGQCSTKDRDGGAQYRENQYPQHKRAFVIAPDPSEFINQWLCRMAVLVDVQDTEIRGDIRPRQRRKRNGHKPGLGKAGDRRGAHQGKVMAMAADKARRRLAQRHDEGENEGEMPDFNNHTERLANLADRANATGLRPVAAALPGDVENIPQDIAETVIIAKNHIEIPRDGVVTYDLLPIPPVQSKPRRLIDHERATVG